MLPHKRMRAYIFALLRTEFNVITSICGNIAVQNKLKTAKQIVIGQKPFNQKSTQKLNRASNAPMRIILSCLPVLSANIAHKLGPTTRLAVIIASVSPIAKDEKSLPSRNTGRKGTTSPKIAKYQK